MPPQQEINQKISAQPPVLMVPINTPAVPQPQARFRFVWPAWAGPVLFFAGVALLIYSVRIGTITGGSMEPNYHEGQRIVVDALTHRLLGVHRGDVIIFTNPHDTSVVEVKRVIGLPNEQVVIEGGTIGVIKADGKYQEFPQGTEIGGNGAVANFKIQLGPEDYFVLGDNRPKSTDSRDFGGVQPVNIKGRVITSF